MKADKKIKKTMVGIELVRRLAEEGDRIFTVARTRELASKLGLRQGYLLEALHHLHNNGWIIPIHRGLYRLSSSVPGISPVHEFELAMSLVKPAAISHWSALHYHGLTEQIPRRVFVLTTTEVSVPRVRGKKGRPATGGYPVGDTVFQFIQVTPGRYFGIEKVWVGEARVMMTDPERTLLDGLARPRYCGDFAEVLHALEARGRKLDLKRIISYALRLDATVAKRLGWALEHQGIDRKRLSPLLKAPVRGFRRLDPSGPGRGPRNRDWMVRENLAGNPAR